MTADELERIAEAEEIEIAPLRRDGTPATSVPIWVVRAGEDLYVRSWRGAGASWFRVAHASHAARVRAGDVEGEVALEDAGEDVNDAVDDAYRSKYGRYPSFVEPMVAPAARATTFRLVP